MGFREMAWLLSAGVVLFGGFFLLTGVRSLRAAGVRRRTWLRFPGEVVASRLDDGTVRCQVAYRRADGTKVLFWNRFSSSMLGDPVGRRVEVLENPADRHDAVVGTGLVGGTVVGVVFTLIGAVFAAGGLVALGVLLALR